MYKTPKKKSNKQIAITLIKNISNIYCAITIKDFNNIFINLKQIIRNFFYIKVS